VFFLVIKYITKEGKVQVLCAKNHHAFVIALEWNKKDNMELTVNQEAEWVKNGKN